MQSWPIRQICLFEGYFQNVWTAFWEPSTQQSVEKPRAKASPKGHSAADTVGFPYQAENIWAIFCLGTRREWRRDGAGTRSLGEDLQSWAGCCCPLPWPSLFDLTLSSSLLASLGLWHRQSKQQSQDNLSAHNSPRHLLLVSRLAQGKAGIDNVLNCKIAPNCPQTHCAILLLTLSVGSAELYGLGRLDWSLYKVHFEMEVSSVMACSEASDLPSKLLSMLWRGEGEDSCAQTRGFALWARRSPHAKLWANLRECH